MKRILTLVLIMIFAVSLTQNSFGQAKGRPNKSSTATPGKVKAKKKGKKAKGAKRIRKGSKKRTSSIQKIKDRNHYVLLAKKEGELIG